MIPNFVNVTTQIEVLGAIDEFAHGVGVQSALNREDLGTKNLPSPWAGRVDKRSRLTVYRLCALRKGNKSIICTFGWFSVPLDLADTPSCVFGAHVELRMHAVSQLRMQLLTECVFCRWSGKVCGVRVFQQFWLR